MCLKSVARNAVLRTPATKFLLNRKGKALTILCVHGVTVHDRLGETANYEGRHIQRDNFKQILECLLRYFNPICLEQLDGYYYGNEALPKNPMLLTFDDGFANNYCHAFPILERIGCPAIIFLATGYMNHAKGFWVERLEYLVHNTGAKRLKTAVLGRSFNLPLDTPARKEAAYRALLGHLKSGPNLSGIEEAVGFLHGQLGFSSQDGMLENEDYRFLTWAEIKQMASSGISFGAHTVNHVNLTHEEEGRAAWEIETSKKEIEKHLSTECIAFCYPFGRSGYNSAMEDLLKRAGLKFSFQLGGEPNDRQTNPFLLNRIPLGWESRKEDVLWHILRK